jgi:hypothetical protein
MAVSAENSRLNLRTASANVRARLGLTDSSLLWSWEQRAMFNHSLAAEILRHPQSFSDDHLAWAQKISGTSYGQLGDSSFSLADAIELTASNAVPVLDGFTNKLILVLALGVAVWAAVAALRSTPTSSRT